MTTMDEPVDRRAQGPGRTVVAALFVFGTAALLLLGMDRVVARATGDPRGVVRHPSLSAAEKRLGWRIGTPTLFPEEFEWPASEIRTAGGGTPSAAIHFRARGGGEGFWLLEAPAAGEIPDRLVRSGQTVTRKAILLGTVPAELRQVVMMREGEGWTELDWEADGLRYVLRFRGPAERFLLIARSVRRGR